MNVLFASIPFVGHLNPLVAQARELQRRGHQVAIASLSEAGAHLAGEAPEVRFIDLGALGDADRVMRSQFEAASKDPDFARGAFRIARALVATWEPIFDGLRNAIAARRPDVMVADLFTAAAVCAAQDAGLRLVVNNPGLLNMVAPAILPPNRAVPRPFAGQSRAEVNWVTRAWARAVPYLGGLLAAANGGRRINRLRRRRGLPAADTEGRLRDVLILVNDAFGFEYPQPLPANIVMVGPMLAREASSLPHELEAWLAEGPPVVYANLGTVAVPGCGVIQAMADAFRMGTFRVLWIVKAAHASCLTAPMPPKVRVLEWGPPPCAILSSPHVRAFVSHCGVNSVHESIWAGTPIVGIPLFADQLDAAVRMADAGAGLWLWKHRLTADAVHGAIRRVIEDGRFVERLGAVQAAFARAGGVRRAADLIEQAAR